MPLLITSSGTFADGFGFGESINKTTGEIRMPDRVLTKLNSIGIVTVEDLLKQCNENTVKVAAALSWPKSYIRDAVLLLLPKLENFDIDKSLLKTPPPVKME